MYAKRNVSDGSQFYFENSLDTLPILGTFLMHKKKEKKNIFSDKSVKRPHDTLFIEKRISFTHYLRSMPHCTALLILVKIEYISKAKANIVCLKLSS